MQQREGRRVMGQTFCDLEDPKAWRSWTSRTNSHHSYKRRKPNPFKASISFGVKETPSESQQQTHRLPGRRQQSKAKQHDP